MIKTVSCKYVYMVYNILYNISFMMLKFEAFLERKLKCVLYQNILVREQF